MEPTKRSNVGKSSGGHSASPNTAANSDYDPIFSPTGRADVHSDSTTPKIISSGDTAAPTPAPTPSINRATPTLISANHTTSTATNDIVLQPSPQPSNNKSKLPLIIGIIAAALAIFAGLFVLIADPFSGSDDNPATTTDTETVANFNHFANYLYDGSDSTELNTELYEEGNTFEINTMFNSDDQKARTKYFNKAQQLLSEVNSSASNIDEDTYSSLVSNLDYLASMLLATPLTEDQFIALYLSNSKDDAQAEITEYYSEFTSSDNEDQQEYGQAYESHGRAYIEVLEFLDASGCIKNKQVDTTCSDSLTLSEDSQQQLESVVKQYEDVNTKIQEAINNLISDTRQLGSNLNGVES